MVYKGCDIGSAKPSKSTLKRFPHEMVDIIKPSEIFTVADFYSLAKKIIDKSHSEKKLPLFVGGSMMYFKSLLDGMHELPQRDNNFRERLVKLKEKNKTHFLFSLLISPAMAVGSSTCALWATLGIITTSLLKDL